MDNTKQQPINLGRNTAKKVARYHWRCQRREVVAHAAKAVAPMGGPCKAPKRKSYFHLFGY